MNPTKPYNVIGIGIGPFNLGLAALLKPVKDFNSLFLDQTDEFNWHPGLMLNNATLQVPFLADLVTMADPTSPFSFLNYLKETGRIYKFYIRENFFLLRKEYNAYCKWAADQLPNCQFSQKVVSIKHANGLYELEVVNTKKQTVKTYCTEKLVLGTGTSPYVPEFIQKKNCPNLIHTSAYLKHKTEIAQSNSVSIIGSGQSAAEVFQDLMPLIREGLQLNWYTRSSHFFPLENNAKLTLELTSPEYIDHFYQLPLQKRAALLKRQSGLYKGIDQNLINQIFEALYEMSVESSNLPVELRSNLELRKISTNNRGNLDLEFTHSELLAPYFSQSEYVILGTGYTYKEPQFLKGIEDKINRFDDGSLKVGRYYTIDNKEGEIFVQNAELHTHGLVTPDLGMGAYRNSCIINQLTNKNVYPVEKRIAFQEFGINKPIKNNFKPSKLTPVLTSF